MVNIYEKKFFAVLILWCILIYLLTTSQAIQYLDFQLIDQLFIWRGPRSPASNIVIVGFDQKTYDKLDKSPFFWNKEISQVVTGLAQSGAKVIAIDLIQSKSIDQTLKNELSTYLREVGITIPRGAIRGFGLDRYMTQAILQTRKSNTNLVMAYEITDNILRGKNLPLRQFEMSLSEANLGYINLHLDVDGVARRYRLYLDDANTLLKSSLALQVAAKTMNTDYTLKDGELLIGNHVFPPEHQIDFHGPRGTFKTLSFADVLDAVTTHNNDMLSQFNGAVVLIGSIFVDDLQIIPFSRTRSRRLTLVPGIEIHATVIDNILTGSRLKKPAFLFGPYFPAACIAFFMVVSMLFKTSVSGMIAALSVVGYCAAVWLAFKNHLVLPLASPLIAVASTFAGTTLYRLFVSERKRRFIRRLFGQYISEPVVNELMSKPEYLKLEGELREVTILFADLRDFTSFSERNKPEKVVAVLNRYFEQMTEAITQNNGVVDKFIGDGIMAFFGAPLGTQTHAEDAVQTALDMRTGLEKLNTQLQVENVHLRFGIGIHSGMAIVGNVGSQKKLEYTVIGDTVNTASRIEAANKNLKTEILLSSVTYEKVIKEFEATAVEIIELKGKKEKYQLFRLEHRKSLMTSNGDEEIQT